MGDFPELKILPYTVYFSSPTCSPSDGVFGLQIGAVGGVCGKGSVRCTLQLPAGVVGEELSEM